MWAGLGISRSSLGSRDRVPVQGIIISTHGGGEDWASPEMHSTIEDIRDIGGNWISIHPYARIGDQGSVRFRDIPADTVPEYLAVPLRDARALGLKLQIAPHLAYWRSKFSWKGDIAFETEEEWTRFFAEYQTWIVNLARATRDADAFVVGTELDLTVHREAEWRRLITAVREVTDVPLTYAANWTHYTEVPFWDALDQVGIQAYFPVADSGAVTPELLDANWKPIMASVRAYSKQTGKQIVFTELGYNRSHKTAVEPWAYHTDGEEAEALQAMCLAAALRAVQRERCIDGAFLWKWFPNPHPAGRNFQLATPAIKGVIADAWMPDLGRNPEH